MKKSAFHRPFFELFAYPHNICVEIFHPGPVSGIQAHMLDVSTVEQECFTRVTAGPSPTQSAGAASRHRITNSPITALTALGTVFSKPAWRTT